MKPLLEAHDLHRHFPVPGHRSRRMYAVNGVSITVRRGEIVGLVGESGCGKSTLARLLLRLLYPTGGTVSFDGMDLAQLSARQLRALRMRMQFVFQDPYSSLDPRMRIEESLLEPFSIHDIRLTKAERSERIGTLLHQVGLAEEHRWRYPREISGGQCQRLSIARALALEPELLILDEPTAALDVSIQAQIIRLLEQLRQQRRLTMLFISHDLPLVGYFCDSLIVLYFGRVMECLPTGARPRHHYTRFLFDSIPVFEPGRRTPRPSSCGEAPSPFEAPQGCVYAQRCPAATEQCRRVAPPLVSDSSGHSFACHHPLPG